MVNAESDLQLHIMFVRIEARKRYVRLLHRIQKERAGAHLEHRLHEACAKAAATISAQGLHRRVAAGIQRRRSARGQGRRGSLPGVGECDVRFPAGRAAVGLSQNSMQGLGGVFAH